MKEKIARGNRQIMFLGLSLVLFVMLMSVGFGIMEPKDTRSRAAQPLSCNECRAGGFTSLCFNETLKQSECRYEPADGQNGTCISCVPSSE